MPFDNMIEFYEKYKLDQFDNIIVGQDMQLLSSHFLYDQ